MPLPALIESSSCAEIVDRFPKLTRDVYKRQSLYCPPGIEGIVVDVKIFSRKGQEKDERAKTIEGYQITKLEKNLSDEIRILTDERLKRLEGLLGGKEVQADLHDERTNKRLLTKDTILDRDAIERISTRNLKRIKYADKDPRVNEQIDEICLLYTSRCV